MQRILWREIPDEPVREYRLNTVTYGTASASFIATQCLEMITRKIKGKHPDANSQRIVSEIPSDLVVNGTNVELAENATMLGVVWSPSSDGFCIKLNRQLQQVMGRATKRIIISYLTRTFDPLGMVAPVLLGGNMMIRALWQKQCDWDVPVAKDVAQKFNEYWTDLLNLESFVIRRCVCQPGSKLQIVGFCDASAKAYCALLYVRSIVNNTVHSCKLLCAKTRVAPMKELTIPKLELSSAL